MSYKKVVIYTKDRCSYCVNAKQLLKSKNIPYEEIDVSTPEIHEKMMALAEGRRTVPQIFFDGIPIGGFDKLSELEMAGKLDALVQR